MGGALRIPVPATRVRAVVAARAGGAAAAGKPPAAAASVDGVGFGEAATARGSPRDSSCRGLEHDHLTPALAGGLAATVLARRLHVHYNAGLIVVGARGRKEYEKTRQDKRSVVDVDVNDPICAVLYMLDKGGLVGWRQAWRTAGPPAGVPTSSRTFLW